MTVSIRSKQKYSVYDDEGRLVAGDPGEVYEIEDIWVFEHGIKLPNPRWRLAARMSLLSPEEEAASAIEATAVDPTAAALAADAGRLAGSGAGGKSKRDKSKRKNR